MTSKVLSLQIQQQLSKEAYYGCIICGCPILEFIDIVNKNSQISDFLPENMVAICPSDHIKYVDGQISESSLRNAKINPCNKVHEEDAFTLEQHHELNNLIVKVGKCTFVDISRILVIDDFDIISIKKEEYADKNYIFLDINFFNKINNLIGIVLQNHWSAERSRDWQINYKSKHLIIQNPKQNIIFELIIQDNEIIVNGEGMFYNGHPIKITNDQILFDNQEIALDIKGTVLKNYEIGVTAETLNKYSFFY
ncbi:MAG TPA: hypothetical protein VFP49_03335 [Nitrososphaeraceae archaeon]|nr:hypothetical protein [Nitrososphaeraceae archaeon]